MDYGEVAWSEDIPPEIRSTLEPHLSRVWEIVPGWVREFRVEFADLGDGASLSVDANYPYRWVRFTVAGPWLAGSEGTRTREVLHELAHVVNAPIQSFVDRLMAGMPEEERNPHLGDWIQSLEASTTDWGWILADLLPPLNDFAPR